MEIITLTHENLAAEHICCAISNNNDCQVASKKAWLEKMLDDGLVFKKLDERGKCFIEYVPAEKAWAPVDAPEYMYIDCLWVSGKFAGQGWAGRLLGECIADSKAKGKCGLAVLTANKKQPFLSDPAFLKHAGFSFADSAAPFYELYYLPFSDSAEPPRFKPQVKQPHTAQSGFVLYYANQCPFTAKYVPIAEQMAKAAGIPFKTVHLETAEQAQNAPAPFTSYSLFCDGKFLTHEIQSEKKLEKLFAGYKQS